MLQADSEYSFTFKTPVRIKYVNVGFMWTFFFHVQLQVLNY